MDLNVERWYSMKEICEYLGVSRDTVLAWIEKREMPAIKIGRLWKFKISEVGRLDEIRRSGGKVTRLTMDEKRLKAFEDMLAAILKQYGRYDGKDGEAQSRRQRENRHIPPAFRNKLQLQAMLSYYRTYGLLDDKA